LLSGDRHCRWRGHKRCAGAGAAAAGGSALQRAAINAVLKRCTPLPFSKVMGDAIAGRPIVIRFVDDRTIDNTKSQQ
jgi:hypothetical protein